MEFIYLAYEGYNRSIIILASSASSHASIGNIYVLLSLLDLLSFPAKPLAQQLLGRFAGPGRQCQKSRKRQQYGAEVASTV